VFLDEVDRGLLERVEARGAELRQGLDALQREFPIVREVRGRGLMLGLRLWHSAKEFQQALYQERVITNCTAGDVIRIVPPFVITAAQVQEGLRRMRAVLQRFPQRQEGKGLPTQAVPARGSESPR
jgi:acetylornithine/succinyldiaminopimelate/putrescine aminotransferase